MRQYIDKIINYLSEAVTRFWILDDEPKLMSKNYPDFPICPFGRVRLVSKKTLNDLMK